MDYRALYDIALKQEQHHFTQLLATGQEHHREQMVYWQGQRQKAAALWTGGPKQEQAARPEPKPEPKANVGVPCVRTYPDLSQRCLAQRLDLPLRLWYILRQDQTDNGGDGWWTEQQVFDLSVGGQRQTKSWLKKGLGIFWYKHGGKYRLAGLGAVVEQLGVKLPKPCVDVPRERLGDLQRYRAALFASCFVCGGDDGITISQAALSRLFGRSTRTLRRWAAMADLSVTYNLATASLPESKEDVTKCYKNGMPRYPRGTLGAMGWTDDGDQQQKGKANLVWFERVDGGLVLVWKMANTYCMAWQPGPKTTLQRNASKRAPDLRGTGANVRMYFDKGTRGGTVAKAIQRQQGPVYLRTGKQHLKTGDVLWSKHG